MLRSYKRWLYSLSAQQRAKLFKRVSLAIFIGVISLSILTTVVFTIFSFGLPDPNKVIRREGLSTIIYDRNGKVLYDLYNKENRIPLELAQIPKYLQQATIAVEDKDFYKHRGFSLSGVFRSVFNILTLKGLSGGSTLTQQLVKTALLSPERTVFRKIREVILASQIEKKFTKDQILQMYLNEVPYGGSSYGVESAAKTYFSKSAKDLNLIESVILAGLPQSPSVYSPTNGKPKAYVDRSKDVLRRMREDGYITAQQENDTIKNLSNFKFASVSAIIKAPHFVFYVRDELIKKFGEQMVESGGLRVTTTLDLDLQEQSEKIVNEEVTKIKPLKVGNGAAVVINSKTGEIITMVGSYDYYDEQYGSYNVSTALRQPGSAGKPFIYATALSKGYTPSTLLMDVKTSYPTGDPNPAKKEYTPENYDSKYRGPMQLRFALANSINTFAVKLTALAGLKDIMQAGYDAGISTWNPTDENIRDVGLSLALGGREVRLLEITSAYGVFATGGIKNDPIAILKITDSNNKNLYEFKAVSGKRVFSEEVSYLISNILSDNNSRKDVFGEVNSLQIPNYSVAVKTGTTDKKRDNWTIGFSPDVVVGVWVGNNDNAVMAPAITSGVTGAAPIWNKITKIALKNFSKTDFKKPDKVITQPTDNFLGGTSHNSDPTRTEYFIRGTEPVAPSSIYQKLKISRANGKLANEIEIKSGNFEEKEYFIFNETDPVSETGKNRWQDAIDLWIAENKKDDPRYNPPKETSDADINSVKLVIDSPKNQTKYDSNNISIKAKAYATRQIVKFTVEIDGNIQIDKATDTLDQEINLSTDKHKLKFKATDSAGNLGEVEINIGVNVPWDYSPPASPSAEL